MPYRSELAAAQARADAAERELENARAQQDVDGVRLAKLERSLAAALGEIADLREQNPDAKVRAAPPPTPPKSAKAGVVAGGAVIGLLFCLSMAVCAGFTSNDSHEDSYYADDFSYLPSDEEVEMVDPFGSGLFLPSELPFAATDPPNPPGTFTEIDVDEGLEKARARAAEYFGSEVASGPFLTGLSAEYVGDDGVASLEYGSVVYTFGVTYEPVPVFFHDTGMTKPDAPGYLTGAPPCEETPLNLQCSVAEVRVRALKAGAPPDALAAVYASDCESVSCQEQDNSICCSPRSKVKSFWSVDIVDRGETLFHKQFADNCRK
jgi:hypothetical protein